MSHRVNIGKTAVNTVDVKTKAEFKITLWGLKEKKMLKFVESPKIF